MTPETTAELSALKARLGPPRPPSRPHWCDGCARYHSRDYADCVRRQQNEGRPCSPASE